MVPKSTEKKRKAVSADSKISPKKARTSKDGAKTAKSDSKPVMSVSKAEETGFEASGSEDEASEDDQTAALLKGFESSEDEAEEKQDADAVALDISTLPDPAAAIKSSQALTKTTAPDQSMAPTVLYLSRIPHGFYEPQMKSYFAQFGDIKRLRLARNRKTGASKHYAFIEFNLPEVAKIVQQTMNNYLMFKHILKIRLVPQDQVHANLWKGAGKRFKAVPWNKIERSRVAGTDREGWSKRVQKEDRRRLEKQEKLKALGYNFNAPKLMDVDCVPLPAKEVAVPIEAADTAGETLSSEAPAENEVVIEQVTKKSKKTGSTDVEVKKVVKSKAGVKVKKSSTSVIAA